MTVLSHSNVENHKINIKKKDEMNFPSNFSLTLGRWGLTQRASLPTIRAILWDPQHRFTNHELPRPMSPMLSKFLGRQGFWGYFDFLWTIRQHHNLYAPHPGFGPDSKEQFEWRSTMHFQVINQNFAFEARKIQIYWLIFHEIWAFAIIIPNLHELLFTPLNEFTKCPCC